MDRRALLGIFSLGTLGVLQFAVAQPASKVYRIGILSTSSLTSDMAGPQPRSPTTRALLGGLRELGYVYGEHFVTEPRGGEGKPERFPALAAELVRRQVDVIVSAGPPAMLGRGQAGYLDDPRRHDGLRRPRALWICPEPGAPGRYFGQIR